MRPRRTALGRAVFLVLPLVVACGGDEYDVLEDVVAATEATPSAPGVVLITLSNASTERLAGYGKARAPQPFLDQLAARGLVFEQAYTPTPNLVPAHVSILTGTYPCEHGVVSNEDFEVGKPAELVSEALAAHGVRSGAFVSSILLDLPAGLDQGFDRFRGPPPTLVAYAGYPYHAPVAGLIRFAAEWLNSVAHDESFFLLLNLADAHFPFIEPPSHLGPEADGYDAELANLDVHLALLQQVLQKRRRDQNLHWIVTSDQGERFDLSPGVSASLSLTAAEVRVPLILAGPEVSAPGRVDDAVSLIDVAPTVLELLQVPAALPRATQALSLLRHRPGRQLLLQNDQPYYSLRVAGLRGTVEAGGVRLDTGDPVAEDVREAFQARAPLGWGLPRLLSEEERARMAEAGLRHLEAGADPLAAPRLSPAELDAQAEVRDRIVRKLAATRAREGSDMLLTGQLGKVRPSERAAMKDKMSRELKDLSAPLAELEERDRDDPFLHEMRGMVQASLQQYSAAISSFQRAVVAQPYRPDLHYNLAVCYSRSGRPQWALEEMCKAVTIDRRMLAAYRWLISYHGQQKQFGVSRWWLQQLGGAFDGSDEIVANMQSVTERVQAGMSQNNQVMEPADGYPAATLLPAGIAARRKD